jgi:Domain of unknown function (DUF4357)
MIKPSTYRIILPDSESESLRLIENVNRNIAGVFITRNLFAVSKNRKEFQRTGVYILVGQTDEDALPRVYVGEGDPVLPRIEQHYSKKDFWTECIIFSSSNEQLNKAHVQYFESRLIDLAEKAKRCILDNQNKPATPSLSEADKADADNFLADIVQCSVLLGVSLFKIVISPSSNNKILTLTSKEITAKGYESSDGFVVSKDSQAALEETPSCQNHLRMLRKALIQNGVIVKKENYYQFTQSYTFNSSSTAGGVVMGRSINGRTSWKDSTGVPLKELQENV